MRIKKKMVSLILAVSLVFGCMIGGTLAWLTDSTDSVENTFTVGNIDINLNETTGSDYKMIPGDVLSKDPKVTVEKGSEACWLFVKIDESGGITIDNIPYDFDDFLTYGIVDDWTQLITDKNGNTISELVYYREVESLVNASDDITYSIIKSKTDESGDADKITVNSTVTKEMMDALEEAVASDESAYPKLTFTAYAVQKANMADAAVAWAEINP